MNVTVIGPRVFVRPDKLPEQTESGLLMVRDYERSTQVGTVIALGDGPVSRGGKSLPHYVDVGERILFSPDAGQEFIFEKETLVSLEENDILAVID